MRGRHDMHPRNIYRKSPDYSELALLYPEFMKIAELDIHGKITLNFKDANVLRTLTKCLLHKDFGLVVEIPKDRLVPTLPLRLNYILWIEDLLNSNKSEESKKIGIDIGAGACAIFSLLAAKKNKWCMIATENDDVNLNVSQNNVHNNNLQDFITVIKSADGSLLNHCFNSETVCKVDFCICNPPFFSSIEDIGRARSPSRPAPRNAFTGSPQELVTDGGEIAFVSKLISESKTLVSKVGIYTTMLGHKTSLTSLMKVLKDNEINNFTHTEFCQGRTTRWGLAWTFSKNYNLKTSVPSPKKKHKEKAMSFIVPHPPDVDYNVIQIANKVLKILDKITVQYKYVVRKQNKVILEITAECNTWSNQRRKRRLLKGFGKEYDKIACSIDTNFENELSACSANNSKLFEIDLSNGQRCEGSKSEDEYLRNKLNNNIEKHSLKSSVCVGERQSNSSEAHLEGKISITQEDNFIVIDMTYLKGPAGKDGIHQILQFIKNNWF